MLLDTLNDKAVLSHVQKTVPAGGKFSIISLKAAQIGEKLDCEVTESGEVKVLSTQSA